MLPLVDIKHIVLLSCIPVGRKVLRAYIHSFTDSEPCIRLTEILPGASCCMVFDLSGCLRIVDNLNKDRSFAVSEISDLACITAGCTEDLKKRFSRLSATMPKCAFTGSG